NEEIQKQLPDAKQSNYAKLRQEEIELKKTTEDLSYAIGLREGALKGISKVLDDLNPKEKAETEEKKKKIKIQKQEIDYLSSAYALRKKNNEILTAEAERNMNNPELNFETRREAMENYYFQRQHASEM